MKIGIDARPLAVGYGGIARALESTLREMLHLDRQNDYCLYSRREFSQCFDSPNWQKRISSRSLALPGTLWLQGEGRRMIIEDHLDVFWGTSHALPLRLPSPVRKVLTIHDLAWRLHPETTTAFNLWMSRLFIRRSISQADQIVADSESTGRDLEHLLGVPRSKIRVVHFGVADDYHPRDPAAAARFIAAKFHVSENYICAVGTIEPRKNLVTLIEAVAILQRQGGLRHQLLIAGMSGWKDSAIYASVRRLGLTPEQVNFLGYVPDEDLPVLYSGAAAFVFPSLYEGFGLPLVEAMACGVAIVASNASSIPEVVKDAAVLVSPHSAVEFADAIARVVSDPELRQSLIRKGLERARHFRWEDTAREMLRLLKPAARDGDDSLA
jgi:glycosyltransferase involved in cell wall biosynthesis